MDKWTESGYGEVVIEETCTVVKGNTYDLVMMPVVNGVALEPVTVSANSCPRSCQPIENQKKRSIIMKKKLTALFLALVMCASLCVPAFAANNSENFDDISTFESTGDVIVLKSGDDLEALHRRDLAKYNEKLANIDANLKESFENFVCQYSETNLLQEDPFENPVSSVDSALLADEFLQAYMTLANGRIFRVLSRVLLAQMTIKFTFPVWFRMEKFSDLYKNLFKQIVYEKQGMHFKVAHRNISDIFCDINVLCLLHSCCTR